MKKFHLALRVRVFRYLYAKYKKIKINNALTKEFDPLSADRPFGKALDERIIEYPWFFSRLPRGKGRLLDAGSVLNFSYLINHPGILEKDLVISTLAPERNCYASQKVSYVYEDMRNMCFKNEQFDYIACLSTLEHVGLDNTKLYTSESAYKEEIPQSYVSVVDELFRVLKPGGILYLSMPFGRRANHGWLQVFDASMVAEVIQRVSPSCHEETYFKYFDDGWRISDRREAQNSSYYDLHSSLSVDHANAVAAEAVVLLELVK